MFPSKTLLSLLFIALSTVDASPLSRRSGKNILSFVAKLNKNGALGIVDKDRARAQAMKQPSHSKRSGTPISVANGATHYTAQIGIGAPATDYTLLIDTGSSNTFVGAGSQTYKATGTSTDTGNTVSVSYGSGSWSGEEWIDTVTLGSGLTITQQSIGVASTSTGFSGVDGILGVGPIDLTAETVSNTNTVPTVVDNLVSQGTITENVLGVYFTPASVPDAQLIANGELTFGGYDSIAAVGPVNYVPFTATSPASTFWGIDQSITYGTTTVLASTAGIVDTGSTLILIATDAFQTYQTLTGATLDPTTTLLTIDTTHYASLQSLTFNIGGIPYELTPNAQTWPRSLNTAIGGTSSSIYLVIADIGTPSGSGLDFINGYTFLERFYSIYDTTNARVGFAQTAYTYSDFN